MSNQILLEDLAVGEGGFVVYGQEAGDAIGYPVAGAGDINGDGFADMVFGAYWADGGGNATPDSGEIYVDVAAGVCGLVIYSDGLSAGGWIEVGALGDVNGDGIQDLGIGVMCGDGADILDGA